MKTSGLGRVFIPNNQRNDEYLIGWGIGDDTALIQIKIDSVFARADVFAESRTRGDATSRIMLEVLGLDPALARDLVDAANMIAEAEKAAIGCSYTNIWLGAFPEGFLEGIDYVFIVEVIPESPGSHTGASDCLVWSQR